ncbi:MAG: D-2-hydroxyacid dehydrogenase [Proteobacteria bacterium]|nr:D-2-hydroxyacid dehydrogenase [Pseudomonadota bacterium]
MIKLVMMPPLRPDAADWAKRIRDEMPEYQIVLASTEQVAAAEIIEADAVFGWVPPEQLRTARKLRWLQSPQAGPRNGFFYPDLVTHPVVVCNPRGVYNDHISQHILMYMLALARGLPYYLDAQRLPKWDRHARKSAYIDLSQATALIVGVGGIGHETARLCNAFGMTVLGVDERWEYSTPNVERHDTDDLDDLLALADFVIVTVPHTPATEGMWRQDRFARMKDSAYFINIGRGATTRLDDLADAVSDGVIAGCALDVFETEPLPESHRLWRLPNVILTPHVAVADAANIDERWFEVFRDNARRFAAGEPLRNVVDKANWF